MSGFRERVVVLDEPFKPVAEVRELAEKVVKRVTTPGGLCTRCGEHTFQRERWWSFDLYGVHGLSEKRWDYLDEEQMNSAGVWQRKCRVCPDCTPALRKTRS